MHQYPVTGSPHGSLTHLVGNDIDMDQRLAILILRVQNYVGDFIQKLVQVITVFVSPENHCNQPYETCTKRSTNPQAPLISNAWVMAGIIVPWARLP